MSLKKTLKKYFWNAEKKIDVIYTSSKVVFLVMTLLFFSLFYCLSSSFYDEFLSVFFLPVYLAFLLAFTCYICTFSIKYGTGKIPRAIIMIFCALCIAMSWVFILPVL